MPYASDCDCIVLAYWASLFYTELTSYIPCIFSYCIALLDFYYKSSTDWFAFADISLTNWASYSLKPAVRGTIKLEAYTLSPKTSARAYDSYALFILFSILVAAI